MAKVYVQLKDKGATFYDISQSKGVSGDEVALLETTEKVNKALRGGALVKVDEAKGKAAVEAQEKAKGEPKTPAKKNNASEKLAALSKLDKVEDDPEGETEVDYSKNTVPELKALAEERGLDASACKVKADYIALLEAADAEEIAE